MDRRRVRAEDSYVVHIQGGFYLRASAAGDRDPFDVQVLPDGFSKGFNTTHKKNGGERAALPDYRSDLKAIVPRDSETRNRDREQLNTWLQGWCRREVFRFLDNWGSFWGRWDLYKQDGLHLNLRGTNILGGDLLVLFGGGGFKLTQQGHGNMNCSFRAQGIESSEVRSTDAIPQDGAANHEGGLKCVYFNSRSVRNKVGELAAWVATWDFDVVAISETWIEQGQEWLMQVPGFKCFSKIREGGKRRGRCGIVSQGWYYGGGKDAG